MFTSKTSWRRLQDMSSRRRQDMSSRRFQRNIFARHLQDVLEDVNLLRWRRVEDVFKTCLEGQQMFAGKWMSASWCDQLNEGVIKLTRRKPFFVAKSSLWEGLYTTGVICFTFVLRGRTSYFLILIFFYMTLFGCFSNIFVGACICSAVALEKKGQFRKDFFGIFESWTLSFMSSSRMYL